MITRYDKYIKESIDSNLNKLLNDYYHRLGISIYDNEFNIYIIDSNEFENSEYYNEEIYDRCNDYIKNFIKNDLEIAKVLDKKSLNILYLLMINLYNNGFCNYNIDYKFPLDIGFYVNDTIEKVLTDIKNHLGNFRLYYNDVDMFVSQYIDNIKDFDNLNIRNLLEFCKDETKEKFEYITHARNFDLI